MGIVWSIVWGIALTAGGIFFVAALAVGLLTACALLMGSEAADVEDDAEEARTRECEQMAAGLRSGDGRS